MAQVARNALRDCGGHVVATACVGASSINSATATVALLAGSKARNPRDITGMMLRVCVVSKVSYMCRTIRPDLFLASARRVDVLLEGAFCTIYSVRRDIFAAGATAEQRLAAARVHLPTSLVGCGLRSAVTTNDAAYVANGATRRAQGAASHPRSPGKAAGVGWGEGGRG
jgi:hypothetical protein